MKLGEHVVHALRGVNLAIHRNEMVGIIGPSGSGKSTLLGIIGGLDTPSTGTVEIDGVDISRMNENQLTDIRNQKIGFVFQFFNLIPTLTAVENVALPVEFAQVRRHQPFSRARELLDMLGLGDRFNHKPNELSGGQQQRVAIARALANDPPILLADEPTGNLDSDSGETVIAALNTIRDESGTTVVLVTHDRSLANQMDRVLLLDDGKITTDGGQVPG
ncbi:MAG: ABC transporter ATP-binding protein [Chloroflexi bacterium]|nr:ABC transporter ATP-binding protein [Chloroflexota bacterium]